MKFDLKMVAHDEDLVRSLEDKAKHLRIELLKMLTNSGSGHLGGSLSAVEILTALYFHHMRYDPENPEWDDRDRFMLSKGHGCPILYVVLSEAGFFPKEALKTHRKLDSILQGHPDSRKTPGIEISTGSLGMGLSVGNGMALAARLRKKDYRVFVLMGDGETDEGSVWEAAMAASRFNIDNLTAIVDRNRFQLDGPTEEIMPLDPIPPRWQAFGWRTIEVDGHDIKQVLDALDEAEEIKGKPTVIIADTVKGKGVSFVENENKYHARTLNEEQLALALKELQ